MDRNMEVARIQLATHPAPCEWSIWRTRNPALTATAVSHMFQMVSSDVQRLSVLFLWWDGGRYIGMPGAATTVPSSCARMAPYRDKQHGMLHALVVSTCWLRFDVQR
jgi:hypothetical protein